ncbi:hypothetical protein PG991_003414 [Apiospora marii]|uniref:Uncharacterized protein n=1 Tax=Apiospora marii TaxID=335849 RepID=A0ABR1S3K3_9PEZI
MPTPVFTHAEPEACGRLRSRTGPGRSAGPPHYEPGFLCISLVHSHLCCFITEACARPPSQILHLLLDNGAYLHDGGFGLNPGALWAATRGQQPSEIVGQILARNGPVSRSCALAPVQHAGAAVARCGFDEKIEFDARLSVEECVEGAKKRENSDVTTTEERK